MPLSGKTILVTGGARRIGAAIVRELAARGANVVIHCNKSVEAAQALAKELSEKHGVSLQVVPRDLSVEGAGESLFNGALEATGGRLDGVVNSASEYAEGQAGQLPDEAVCRSVRIHAEAPEALLRRLAAMPGDDQKVAVNILDCRVARGDDATHAPYLVGKRRLAERSRALALELAPRLRLNCVAPGAVLESEGQSREDFLRLADFNPMRAVGNPSGLADCVAFLLATDFICGQTLFYDGGYSLRT